MAWGELYCSEGSGDWGGVPPGCQVLGQRTIANEKNRSDYSALKV